MGNKERRHKRGLVGKIPVVVCGHPLRSNMLWDGDIMEEVQVESVECPFDHKPFKDVGSFIHHMWVMHEWDSTDSLIYWSDNYRAEELEDE